jgi:hypothetical protein
MTKLSKLSVQHRQEFEQDLELAFELADLPVAAMQGQISVSDLYRFARNASHNRNGEVRRAIVSDLRINRYWASILSKQNGSQCELAAAAAGPNERIVLQDGRKRRRVEFTRSSSDPELGILIVDLGETTIPAPTRLSIWTSSKAFELDLPEPHLGVCQIDLQYAGEISALFRDGSVKIEIW